MEGYSWLAQFLLETSAKLALKQRDPQIRQRFGKLLSSIADCIESIGDAVRRKEHPAAECVELAAYLRGIHLIAEKAVDKKFADEIVFWLEHVAEAPGVAKIDLESALQREAKPRWSQAARYQKSVELKNVAAMIRATANLVQV